MMIERIKRSLKKLEKLEEKLDRILPRAYATSLLSDALLTYHGLTTRSGFGEANDFVRSMMINYGHAGGLALSAGIEALAIGSVYIGSYLLQKLLSKHSPQIEKYTILKKIGPYSLLAYFGIGHLIGAISWLK